MLRNGNMATCFHLVANLLQSASVCVHRLSMQLFTMECFVHNECYAYTIDQKCELC